MKKPMFRDTVHIVPFGYEYDRIMKPIEKGKADTVVLLNNSSPSDTRAAFQDELQQELQDNPDLELDTRICDIFDLYGSLEAILEAISDYSEEDVYVNLAAGSKVTALAGMIACMASDADPFYVRAEISGSRPPDREDTPGFRGIVETPEYPIDKPTPDQIHIMNYIYSEMGESEARKKELIDYAVEEELEFTEGSGDVTEKALYPRLDNHIVDPLTEKGFLETEKRGNTTRVRLTPGGEKAIQAFRHTV